MGSNNGNKITVDPVARSFAISFLENVLWNKTFNSINVGSATVVNDLVFTATFDGTIYGFRITTGEQLFTYKAPAGINGWPAVAGDIFVWPASVGVNGSVIAFSTRLATRNFTSHGLFSGGRGFTPASISSPGPTSVVEQGGAVNLTLISNDGVTHRSIKLARHAINATVKNTSDDERKEIWPILSVSQIVFTAGLLLILYNSCAYS